MRSEREQDGDLGEVPIVPRSDASALHDHFEEVLPRDAKIEALEEQLIVGRMRGRQR